MTPPPVCPPQAGAAGLDHDGDLPSAGRGQVDGVIPPPDWSAASCGSDTGQRTLVVRYMNIGQVVG